MSEIRRKYNGRFVTEEELDKLLPRKPLEGPAMAANTYTEHDPLISEALGVMKSQVKEMRETLEREKIPGVAILDNGIDPRATGPTERQEEITRLFGANSTESEENLDIVRFLSSEYGPLPYSCLRIVLSENTTPGGHSAPGTVLLTSRPALLPAQDQALEPLAPLALLAAPVEELAPFMPADFAPLPVARAGSGERHLAQ